MGRRAKGEPPKYSKEADEAHGERAKVVINGQRYRLGAFGSPESYERFEYLLGLWRAGKPLPTPAEFNAQFFQVKHRPLVEALGVRINEMVDKYLEWAESYYVKDGKPTGEYANILQAVNPFLEKFGDLPAKDFGPRKFKELQRLFTKAGKRGWCRNYINKSASRIKGIFKWAVGEELIPGEVYNNLKPVSGLKKGRVEGVRESEKVGPVPEDDILATQSHVSETIWAMIQVQKLTAARPGEVRQMRVGEFDESDRVWIYKPRHWKTEHYEQLSDRAIAIGPQAQAWLKPYMDGKVAGQYVFNPKEAEAKRYEKFREENLAKGLKGKAKNGRKRKWNLPIREKELGDYYDGASYRRAIQRACRAVNAERKREASKNSGKSKDGDPLHPRRPRAWVEGSCQPGRAVFLPGVTAGMII